MTSQPLLFSIHGGTFLDFYRCGLIIYQLINIEKNVKISKKQLLVVRENKPFLCHCESLININVFQLKFGYCRRRKPRLSPPSNETKWRIL